MDGIGAVARALNAGDPARACLAAVFLRLPETPEETPQALAKCALALAESGLLRATPQEVERVLRSKGEARLAKFNPNHDERGRFSSAPGQLAAQNAASGAGSGSPSGRDKNAATRAAIANAAAKYVNSTDWAFNFPKGKFGKDTNKCNLFVYDVTTEAGASPGLPGGWFGGNPPTAGQWADPNYVIPGWRVLPAATAPEPGDVAAQSIDYRDASGHVMIVGEGNTLIGTEDDNHVLNGRLAGTIMQIPMPQKLGPLPRGPIVFRRWGR